MVELLSTANLKRDIPSGLVVFLVALPLCLGISLASGAPFFSGLISGIIGGLVIGFLSTSHLSVSGPAAGLAALVLAAISNVGSFNLFLCSVVIAGVLQIGMGFLRLGGIAEFFPSSVIKGMLTSIGILIIAKQIPHAVGYDRDEKGTLSQLLPFGNEDWHELLKPFHHIEAGVALLCLVSIAIIVLWELPAVKQKVKVVPGALVAVVVSVLLNELFTMSGSFLSVLPEHLVQIQSASSVGEFFSFFTFPDVNGFTNGTVLVTGVMIAVIASLETLLSVEAVDNLDPKRRVTNTNKELVAQGIGNVVSGLIGGLPITSVIVRSSANINAGAVSKFSAMFHGILLLLSVIAIPFLLNRIPLAALAAILLVTGYKLCRFSIFTQMLQSGKSQSIPFFTTVGVIIGIDLLGLYPPFRGEGLLVGVVAGLVIASIGILLGNFKNSYYFHKETYNPGDSIHMHLSEEVSFLNKASIRESLDHIPNNSTIIIDASNTRYIDFDVLEIIKEFRDIKAPIKNITCTCTGFKESYLIENRYNIQSSH